MVGNVIDFGLHRVLTQLQINSYSYSKENQRNNIGFARYQYDENNVVEKFKFFYKIFLVKEDMKKYAIVVNAIDLVKNQYRYSAMQLLKNEDKIYKLSYIEENLKRTIDLFIDGIHVSGVDIDLFIAENTTVILIPTQYIADTTKTNITINVRTYIAENRVTVDDIVNSVSIPIKYSKMIHNVYCDGVLVTDYTTTVQDNEIILKFVSDYRNKNLDISIVKDIKMQQNIPAKTKYFKIEGTKGNSIPDNIFLFADGILQTTTIKNQYPNIFEIEESIVGPDKVAQVFYKNRHIQDVYDPIYKYDELFDLVNQLNTNMVPNYIKTYTIPDIGYTMNNYRTNYNNISLYDFQKALFASAIKHDPYNYNKYLDMLNIAEEPKIINMNLKNYSVYLRADNKKEISDTTLQKEFTEEKVLICFSNPINSCFNIYINGLITENYEEFFKDELTYLYFSKNDITSSSIVEIELFKNISDFSNNIDYILTEDMIEYNLILSDLFANRAEDIMFFVYNDIKKCYIYTELINLSIVNGQLSILHDSSLIGKKIKLTNTWIASNKTYSHFKVERNFNKLYIRHFDYCKKDKMYYSVFLDGRYIDRTEYDLDYPTETNEDKITSIRLGLSSIEKDEVAIVQYHPFKKQTIFYSEQIPENGIVYLNNLPAAFSLKYFDVYLNGRKLNYTNMSIVSENVIVLRNISSRGPLYVTTRYMAELPYENIFSSNVTDVIINRPDKTITSIQDLIVIAVENTVGNTQLISEYSNTDVGDIINNPDIVETIKDVFKPETVISENEEEEDPYRGYVDNAIVALWYDVYKYMHTMTQHGYPVINANVEYTEEEILRRFYPLIKNGKIPINANTGGMLIRMPLNSNNIYSDELINALYGNLYDKIKSMAVTGEQIINANTVYDENVFDDFYPILKRGKISINANRALPERLTINANKPIN